MTLLLQTLDSFRYRDYRIVWTAGLSMTGSYWFQQIVIGWLMFDTTGSAVLTSIALGLDTLPFLFLAPVGGIVADRWDRRHVMAVATTYMAVVTLGLAVVVMSGKVQTWHILAYALIIGLSFPLMDPAWLSLMVKTVPKKNIVNALALNGLAGNGSRLVFPPIGGLIIARLGPGQALVAGAALYAVASAAILAVTRYEVDQREGRRGSGLSQFTEGLRYVRSDPIVLVLVLMTALLPLTFLPAVNRMMPVYASEVFAIGPTGLGLLMAVIGVGSTIGTIALASTREIGRRGRVLVVTIMLSCATMVGFSLADGLASAMTLLLLVSAVATVYWSLSEALVMEISPDHLRGRVASLAGASMGLFPLARIHRRTSFGTALEEAGGCPSESGIMVLEQKPARKQGAPNRCCHRTNPTVSASSLTTIAWWPMPACSCRPP